MPNNTAATGHQGNFLVFLCYGNIGIFHECAYALLTLSRLYGGKLPDDWEIWIYTDKPEFFRALGGCPLPLHYRTLDAATIQQWKGPHGFVHRVKIALLQEFAAAHTGNILYSDTDVVFSDRLEPVFSKIGYGSLYMHVAEGIVGEGHNPVLTKLAKHTRRHHLQSPSGQPLAQMVMWNAGVLGFNSRLATLLEGVLEFTDREYGRFPKHIVEQFAFSVYFGQHGPIKSAAHYITHYWNLKEARHVLEAFFVKYASSPWSELADYSQLIHIPVMMQDKANFYRNRSLAGKMLKKTWLPAVPNWEELVRQL